MFNAMLRPECLIFLIPIVAIIMGGITAIYRMKLTASQGGDISRRSGRATADDMRTIQELHRGFERLNERVEALETILLDRAKKG